MKPVRDAVIDTLRSAAVIFMVIIHVTTYFKKDQTIYLLWDFAHFVVPIFIFCSSYIYFKRADTDNISIKSIIKRAWRILLPYYLFVVALFVTQILLQKTLIQVPLLTHVVLGGNYYLTWLVVLFLIFTFLFPILRIAFNSKVLFWVIFLISLLSSIYFMIYRPHISFRYTMALPWILIVAFGYLGARHGLKIRSALINSVIFFLIFTISRYVLLQSNKSLILIDNKYPPNLYHLSYGLGILNLIIIASRLFVEKHQGIMKINTFLSRHSYSIFLIHFYLLFLVLAYLPYWKYGWLAVSTGLIIATSLIIILSNKIKSAFFNIVQRTNNLDVGRRS